MSDKFEENYQKPVPEVAHLMSSEEAAKKEKNKKKLPPRKATVDYRKQGRDANLSIMFVIFFTAAAVFFAFSYWIRTPDEKIIHQRSKWSHLNRRPTKAKKRVNRSVRGYKISY